MLSPQWGGVVGENDGFEEFPADIATIPSGGETIEGTFRGGDSLTSVTGHAYRIGNMVFISGVISRTGTPVSFYVDGLNIALISQNIWSVAVYTAVATSVTGKNYTSGNASVEVEATGSLRVTITKSSLVQAQIVYDPAVHLILLVDE